MEIKAEDRQPYLMDFERVEILYGRKRISIYPWI